MTDFGYMTDEEAWTQTCPFMRFCLNEDDVRQYKDFPIYVHQQCQGSACRIAWRQRSDGKGYCGIAGRPTGYEGAHHEP